MTSLKDCEIWRGIHSYSTSAFDREQAIEVFREDFKDDMNLNKVRITRVRRERQNGMGDNIYTIFFRLDGKEELNRPNCIECGSNEVISKGITWLCKSCGRWFKKRRR